MTVSVDFALDTVPGLRGKVIRNADLAPYVWFRVGGPADWLFLPEDADDLATALRAIPADVPVTVLGVGSNVLIRDGGVPGVVIRLGRGFAGIEVLPDHTIRAGAAVLDATLAKAAATAGIAGLEFFRGVPGTIGGACVMNAGCYGAETKDVLISVEAMQRDGTRVTLSNAEMGFSYRHSGAADTGLLFLSATFKGTPDDPKLIEARMAEITAKREASQPVREKTGGSTFRNPDGHKSWQLIDGAGWRGRGVGGAQFSPLHANFLINTGTATAADLEATGEAARADVKAQTGVDLIWEIKRLGRHP
jgi:UDP-N-acetylmuramate dehydrogenase